MYFTTHIVFLQHLDSSPLDLYCFSVHLCRPSPVLTLLFRSLSFSILIVSPLLMLLSFLDFSSVSHLTWSPHVTCDTCAESHSNDLILWNDYAGCPCCTPERKVTRRVPTRPTTCLFFQTTALLIGLGCRASCGNAGRGGGKVASFTAVEARLGALLRVVNTDGLA